METIDKTLDDQGGNQLNAKSQSLAAEAPIESVIDGAELVEKWVGLVQKACAQSEDALKKVYECIDLIAVKLSDLDQINEKLNRISGLLDEMVGGRRLTDAELLKRINKRNGTGE